MWLVAASGENRLRGKTVVPVEQTGSAGAGADREAFASLGLLEAAG